MRLYATILIAFVLLSSCSLLNNSKGGSSLDDGLIAYYPFNGSAIDETGNGNDAEVYGATLTADRFNKPNSSYSFDGDFDYLQVEHNIAFETKEKSISFWFYKGSNEIGTSRLNNNLEAILYKAFDTGFSRDFSFELSRPEGPFNLFFAVGDENQRVMSIARLDESIESNQWYHVVGIIDSDGNNAIYLNNALFSIESNDLNPVPNSAPLLFGKSSVQSLPERYFLGKIDDVRLYNRVLTPKEITALFEIDN